jgi:Flp pilus assembly pilin Flp
MASAAVTQQRPSTIHNPAPFGRIGADFGVDLERVILPPFQSLPEERITFPEWLWNLRASALKAGKTFVLDIRSVNFWHDLYSEGVAPRLQAITSWCVGEEGQDIAEYAVMLAVILVIVVGTVKLIGSNANNVFSNVASSMQ